MVPGPGAAAARCSRVGLPAERLRLGVTVSYLVGASAILLIELLFHRAAHSLAYLSSGPPWQVGGVTGSARQCDRLASRWGETPLFAQPLRLAAQRSATQALMRHICWEFERSDAVALMRLDKLLPVSCCSNLKPTYQHIDWAESYASVDS